MEKSGKRKACSLLIFVDGFYLMPAGGSPPRLPECPPPPPQRTQAPTPARLPLVWGWATGARGKPQPRRVEPPPPAIPPNLALPAEHALQVTDELCRLPCSSLYFAVQHLVQVLQRQRRHRAVGVACVFHRCGLKRLTVDVDGRAELSVYCSYGCVLGCASPFDPVACLRFIDGHCSLSIPSSPLRRVRVRVDVTQLLPRRA